jgi:hypothetical protein
MSLEDVERLVRGMRQIASVEDFEVVADDRAHGKPGLVVLPAGLALRLFWNDGGAELCEAYFAAITELDEMSVRLAEITEEFQ